MMMESCRKYRLGAVSYLNTKPLVYQLDRIASNIEVIYDLPSRLSDELAAGRLDVALIPSIEYFQNPSYSIVSDACIACRGPVLSVKLLSRVPVPQIRTLALDEGSRTSVALVRILLKQRFGLIPQCEPLPFGREARDTAADAVLLIGDRAIYPPDDEFVEQWDLGDQWCRWAELPLVFAMWTARAGLETSRLSADLKKTRDEGVTHLREIAEAEAASVRMTVDECLSYLRDNLYFYLGPRERRGLELFRRQAAELGMAPADRSERVLVCEKSVPAVRL